MSEYSGFGVTLQVDNSGYVNIAQVRDLNGPSMAMDTIESSHRDAAQKKFLAGLLDGGEVTFDIAYDPDVVSHAAGAAPGLVYYMNQRSLKSFKLLFPDSTPTSATFSALVTKFNPKAPLNGLLTADVTLKLSGAITWA